MKSTVCKQKPQCRLLVTLDSTCHSPSLQYQTVCNAHQSHRSAATQSLPERRKRRRGEKEKARTYHLSAVSKTSKSRKLEESMALGQQHSHPLSYIPCKKLLLQRFCRHWSLQYFVLSSWHRRCGRGKRSLLVGAWQPVLPVGNATVGGRRGRSHSPVTAPGSHSAYFWGQTPAWGLLAFAHPISTYFIYITQTRISYASGGGVSLQPVVWSHLGFCSQCSLEQDPLKLGGLQLAGQTKAVSQEQ